ncbi:hypothetical protein F2P81_016768 [Scophthalmus maximus]|uniref:Breast cancer type 2 susceptibility protein n=1 Tax=Scophthalmus maximus TaxID=52904 RepID=A0A6A4SA28_SCOMX|nr:hypothetical protein F2P81_016768 [Scophthalmus maximus]
MDLPSKNMYDAFKDHIWKELGPLDPDWFQVLTAQTFTGEESVSDPDDLCANQEGHFKTPLDKAALDSQLFSTPKVFRHRRVVSPETTEGEQSFTPEQEKETLPWTETQSPQLFRVTKESVPGAKYGGMRHQNLEHFDMVHTPSKSPVSYAKQISESLGAQIHPDISWTSSLNTPPAVPSTLILSKTDESPCPMSVSEDKTVVIVRKLFPSLSNGAGVAATSPTNTGLPLPRGVISPEADQIPESHGSPQESLNPTASVWRQKLPDAIEGGDVRSTVASVLDGAENVLSIFFSNSSSALRKVKTDRVKRKQIIATKEHGCSFTDILTANNAAVAPSEQRTEELEPVELSSPPQLKTRDIGITQWSPLSLSEIPPFTDSACCEKSHATQVENNILTERPQSDSVSGQLVRLPLTGTFSGFTKRKRKFVYTIDTSRIQGKETASLKTDSSSQIPDSGYKVSADLLRKAPDEAACHSIRENEKQKQKNVTGENLPLSVQPNVQDLDMSQLCRDFEHDFTQTSDPGKLSEVAKDNPRNGFSPSACLSAMKQAKQKAKQASVPPDCDGVSVRRPVSATNQNDSINEGTVSDSGFQSAVADITHPTSTSFILPSSENIGQSQQWSTTGTYRAASSLSTNTRNRGKNNLDEMLQEAETDAKLPGAIKESRTLVPCRKNEHTESTSTQLPGGAKGSVTSGICFPFECQVNDSFPEKTTVSLPSVHASGFKTASNKTIKISSVDLEKAKHLFEENEAERTFSDQPSKRAHDTKDEISMSDVSGKNTIPNQPPSSREHFGDISCQLTVSQKADVTELCTLLEEADSQFEFTQFKTAKLQQHCQDNATSPRKVDKELDPDFLMGIDFDDSFDDRRSDAEKHLVTAVMLDKMTLVADHKTNCETSKVTSKSSMKKENASIEDALSSSKCISEGSHGIMSAEPQNLDRARCTETSKQENKSPLMLGGGFKTARGNFLTVSKECLSKARALFADLEDNLTEQKSAGEQSGDAAAETDQRQVVCIKDNNAAKSFKNDKIDTTTCQSGRGISISAKAMKEADALFKDCDISENNTGGSVKHEKNVEHLPSFLSHKKNLLKCKNIQETEENFSAEGISEFKKGNAGPAACHTEVVQHIVEMQSAGLEDTKALTNAVSSRGNLCSTAKTLSSPSGTASKNSGSSAVNQLSNGGGGFCTASGKKVSVSADAVKKAERLLSEIHTHKDTNQQLKGEASRTAHLTNQFQVGRIENGGFQTASGKGVVISAAALKKAKSLLSECEAIEDKKPVCGLPSRNSGFLAASGKPVALSAAALQKAKALFSDITVNAGIPAASDTRKSDSRRNNSGNSDKIPCGFMTAGGTTVCVSQNNLFKATNALREFDGGSLSEKTKQGANTFFKDCDTENGVAPVSGGSSEHGHGCSEFENSNVGSVVNEENLMRHDNAEILKGVFKNSNSTSGNPSFMAKPLSSPLCTTSKNTGSSAFSGFSNGVGFCSASGKRVSVSDEAMTKAKSLLNESATFPDTDKKSRGKADNMPPQIGGKDVALSFAAPEKAKTLPSKGVEDKISVESSLAKMPVSFSPPRICGFLAASGKPMAFSSEALQKAKALFNDIGFSEVPIVSDKRKSDKHEDVKNINCGFTTAGDVENINCGFTTAGGAKVQVSQKNLMNAKNLLKDFADGESPSESDLSNVKKASKSCLTASRDKDMFTKESAPQVVKSFQSLQETEHENETLQNSTVHSCISVKRRAITVTSELKEGKIVPSWEGNLRDTPVEEAVNVLGPGVNHTSSGEALRFKSTEESSFLMFQSLNLSGCSETQQRFFAQEALDCTKALLEDESLAGQSPTVEKGPLQDTTRSNDWSAEEQKGRGKRSVDDADMTGQPPLKRRLLDEFDRTVDGPRGSTLHPQKSSPNSVMKDRRAFKYSVSPHPNITRPYGSGTNYVETKLQNTTPTQRSASGDGRSAHCRVPAFVPPFLKNTKTETHKNAVVKVSIKTPSAFVPPFKKQRTVVQESSCKPQEEEDKHQHVCIKPTSSNIYMSPSRNTQNSADATSDKSKEYIQAVALAHTTNDNLMNNQKAPGGCGSEDSAAMASCDEDTVHRGQGVVTYSDEAIVMHM